MSNDPDYEATQKARRAKRDALRAQQPMGNEPRSAAEAEDMLREARAALRHANEHHERELAAERGLRESAEDGMNMWHRIADERAKALIDALLAAKDKPCSSG